MRNILSFPFLLEEFAKRREPLIGERCVAVWVCGPCQLGATALRVSDAAREHEVQREIDSFLQALSSYPDRFAREPYLSFQQHLSSIVTEAHPPSTDE